MLCNCHWIVLYTVQGISSFYFKISNGVRQGGILSPFLFRYYIRYLIQFRVTSSKIGCHLYNMCSNLLAYADDMVLLAPSWHGLQQLLNIITVAALKLTCVLILRKLSLWSLILIILINGCILCSHLFLCLVANCHL